MRLTWQDAGATAVVAAVGGLYAWHLAAPDAVFVGSARWTSVTFFVLGVTACVTGSHGDVPARYSTFMSGGGAAAFVLMLTTLVTGSEAVLAAIVGVIGALWLITTVRHALGTHHETPGGMLTGAHERIEPTHHA